MERGDRGTPLTAEMVGRVGSSSGAVPDPVGFGDPCGPCASCRPHVLTDPTLLGAATRHAMLGTRPVYDVTRRETFEALEGNWMREFDIYSTVEGAIKMVVANKVDLVGG